MKGSDNMELFAQMETLPFTKQQKAALLGQAEMTCDLFWECLCVCSAVEDTDTFLRFAISILSLWMKNFGSLMENPARKEQRKAGSNLKRNTVKNGLRNNRSMICI